MNGKMLKLTNNGGTLISFYHNLGKKFPKKETIPQYCHIPIGLAGVNLHSDATKIIFLISENLKSVIMFAIVHNR